MLLGAVAMLGERWGVQLGRLPGDIVVKRDGFTLLLPITSMILVSLLLSLAAFLLRSLR